MTSAIASLRALVPHRALTVVEAVHFAERQAGKLLELSDLTQPPVPDGIITSLPRIRVERIYPLAVSGVTRWIKGRWVIVLNAGEPAVRQRFSLAHEFKHVLDSAFDQGRLLYPPLLGMTSEQQTEASCDQFAACLLMPRPWVKRAWGNGVQDSRDLAQLFEVSLQAMQFRLLSLGLTEPTPRCGRRIYYRSATIAA